MQSNNARLPRRRDYQLGPKVNTPNDSLANINNPLSPINHYGISRVQDQIRVNEWFHLHFRIQKQPSINQTETN